jgi:uncharacterized protein YjbJ (UPF0337 family)
MTLTLLGAARPKRQSYHFVCARFCCAHITTYAALRCSNNQRIPPQPSEMSTDPTFQKRKNMNLDTTQGNWKEIKGKLKEKWGKLTDDDLTRVSGKIDQLEGFLQQRYGYEKEQAKMEADVFRRTHLK